MGNLARVEVKNLSKTYGDGISQVKVLRDLSVKIYQNQFTTIMGPSGSGKSTLLHLLGGLDQPTSGSVLMDGQPINLLSDSELSKFRRRKLGFIFQFFNLLPTLSAVENVALPLLLDGHAPSMAIKRAEELLDFMGLKDRFGHRPDQLSGGQMQRVAIARALITEPIMILADEPTGNLDSTTAELVLQLLIQVVKERGQTVVMVTHDQRAALHGDRLIQLRDGIIESDRLLREPHNAQLVERVALVAAAVT